MMQKEFVNYSMGKTKLPITKNKRIMALVLLLVALVLIGIGIYFAFNSSSQNLKKELQNNYDTSKPILIKKDGLYGFVDTKGKQLTDLSYKTATEFYGDYAVVSDDNGSVVINRQGKTILEIESSTLRNGISYIEDYGVWLLNGRLYNSDMKLITDEEMQINKYLGDGYFTYMQYHSSAGIIDYTGKEIYTYHYPDNKDFLYVVFDLSEVDNNLEERYVRINIENDKYGIVSLQSKKIILGLVDDYVFERSNNVFDVKNSNFEQVKTVFCHNDKVALEVAGASGEISMYDKTKNLLSVKDNNKKYYYRIADGKTFDTLPSNEQLGITDVEILDEWEQLSGYKKSSCPNGYGLEKDGREVIPCEFESIQYLNNKLYQYLSEVKNLPLVIVFKDGYRSLYNIRTNKIYFTFGYDDSIGTYSSSTFLTQTSYKEGKIVYNVLSNKSMNFDYKYQINVYSNYFTVSFDGTIDYYNTDFEKIYTNEGV